MPVVRFVELNPESLSILREFVENYGSEPPLEPVQALAEQANQLIKELKHSDQYKDLAHDLMEVSYLANLLHNPSGVIH